MDWYIRLGFTKIFIIQNDRKQLITYPSDVLVKVIRDNTATYPDEFMQKYLESTVRVEGCEWLLVVDLDEYLLLDQNKYKTIADFVDSKEKTYGKGYLDVIQFRWAIIENIYPKCYNSDFISMLKDFSPNIYWNVMIKSMVRMDSLLYYQNSHCPTLKKNITKPKVYFESKITNAIEGTFNTPVGNETYNETALVHIHTRSLYGMMTKAFDNGFDDKIIKNNSEFLSLLTGNWNKTNLLNLFIKAVGMKASIPYSNHPYQRNDYCLNIFPLLSSINIYPTYMSPMCDKQKEINTFDILFCNFLNGTRTYCYKMRSRFIKLAKVISKLYLKERRVCHSKFNNNNINNSYNWVKLRKRRKKQNERKRVSSVR
jgi:hypothetical protein